MPVAPWDFGATMLEKRELMRAFSRLANALLGAALALAPAAGFAQQTPSSPPAAAPDSVGPGTLQNFSLSGTVTRPADQTAAPAAKKPQPSTEAQPPVAAAVSPALRKARPAQQAASVRPRPAPQPRQTANATPAPLPSPPVTAEPSNSDPAPAAASTTSTPAAAPVFAPPPSSTGTLAPTQGFGILPWLLAALAFGAGGAFLFWRNRLRHAVAAGPLYDLRTPFDAVPVPEPKTVPPPPAPTPSPRPAAPASSGVVSSLRPWIEIGFQPLRCILEDQLVRVEFEIELFNSGSSPARDVLVEATLVNAGEGQDERIAAFFAKAPGPGERLPVILPLKRLSLKNQVFVPRDQLHAYELAGRQLFVPLIAFNAFYRTTGGPAQTSVSYLLGRDTNGEKLAPFRADLGPRIFRGLAARALPAVVRR